MTSKTKDYSKPTDETLVRLASDGDISAEKALIERYGDSVKITAALFKANYASKHSLSSLEFDDLFQEGLSGLMSAIYSFREEKNVTFRTYAARCISNQILSAIKTSARKKNTPPGGVVSIDDIEIPSKLSLEEKIISDEGTESIYVFLNNELSPLELSVIKAHLKGESYKCISEQLGISEKSVDNAIQRVRSKLSRFLSENRS